MRIGIDISQLAYPNSGVANYLQNLIEHMIASNTTDEFILFFSSLRGRLDDEFIKKLKKTGGVRITIKKFRFPPTVLELVWNRLHMMPIEFFIGKIDVFLSSDWVQPPTSAKKATILYDLIVYTYPEETHNQWKFSLSTLKIASNIVASQKRRLKHVKNECDAIFCISEATKKDAMEILHIPKEKLYVAYPGLTL